MINRSNTVKKIAGTTAIVGIAHSAWTKPTLSSVNLPRHSQTSNKVALTISCSGPVTESAGMTKISANLASDVEVVVELNVNAPFSLSTSRLAFKPLAAGQSEKKIIDILNADRSVNAIEEIKVSWVES